MNSRKLSNLKYPDTENYLELDVWFPDLSIGFEFQVFLLFRFISIFSFLFLLFVIFSLFLYIYNKHLI